jgi:hypothetical protein
MSYSPLDELPTLTELETDAKLEDVMVWIAVITMYKDDSKPRGHNIAQSWCKLYKSHQGVEKYVVESVLRQMKHNLPKLNVSGYAGGIEGLRDFVHENWEVDYAVCPIVWHIARIKIFDE